MTWLFSPVSSMSRFQIHALRPHFENDVVLTRVVIYLEAKIIIRPHFER
jgi:hypothetical protein